MKQTSLQLKLQKISSKIQQNIYLSAISEGLMSLMVIMIIGALFTLINGIPIPAYQSFLESSGLKTLTALPLQFTTNIFSIYASFSIANKFVSKFDMDGVSPGIIAIMQFLILTPLGALEDGTSVIQFSWIGSTGLFVAMIAALVTGKVYVLVMKKGYYIKMPKGVPPTIEKSFASITPGVIVTILSLFIAWIFSLTSFENIHNFVFSFIQAPFAKFGVNPAAFILIMFLIHLLWFFGIHGVMMFMPLKLAAYMPLDMENLAAFQAGEQLPHMIINGSFGLGIIGGSGATIGLVIAMVMAKSKQYKTLGRLSIIPGFCGINEPILFGTPLVLNTRFFIPLVSVPTILAALGVGLTYLGVLPPLNGVVVPMGVPLVASGFIVGGWRIALWQVFAIVFSYFAYLPFFRAADQEALSREVEAEKKVLVNEKTAKI